MHNEFTDTPHDTYKYRSTFNRLLCYLSVFIQRIYELAKTSVDVLPSKNQALCEMNTVHMVSKLKHC